VEHLCAHCAPACPAGCADTVTCRARHLYTCLGWSTRRVATACGISRPKLTGLLRAAGVPIAPRGAGRARPTPDPANLRDTLTELYLRQQLSSTRIAALLGMSDRLVRAKLARHGIRRRTGGSHNREDRTRLTSQQVRELAVLRDLPATDISALTATGYLPVLRDLHTAGVPVRLGGDRIEVIDALYADRQVRSVLAEYRIPLVPAGGRLWERFPVPVPLRPDLLHRLYVDCGLSAPHIELLTGQPAATIRHHLIRYAIPRRPPGGRSPFLRRWQEASGAVVRRGSARRGVR
jgi:transposase-like protein